MFTVALEAPPWQHHNACDHAAIRRPAGLQVGGEFMWFNGVVALFLKALMGAARGAFGIAFRRIVGRAVAAAIVGTGATTAA